MLYITVHTFKYFQLKRISNPVFDEVATLSSAFQKDRMMTSPTVIAIEIVKEKTSLYESLTYLFSQYIYITNWKPNEILIYVIFRWHWRNLHLNMDVLTVLTHIQESYKKNLYTFLTKYRKQRWKNHPVVRVIFHFLLLSISRSL